jgi:hypothetical protein
MISNSPVNFAYAYATSDPYQPFNIIAAKTRVYARDVLCGCCYTDWYVSDVWLPWLWLWSCELDSV